MRLTMADEFAELWVFNLRGNQRTAGEQSRKEGGKVFGSGSRNTVAIVLAVVPATAVAVPAAVMVMGEGGGTRRGKGQGNQGRANHGGLLRDAPCWASDHGCESACASMNPC